MDKANKQPPPNAALRLRRRAWERMPQGIALLVQNAYSVVPSPDDPQCRPPPDWPSVLEFGPTWELLNTMREQARAHLIERGWLTEAELDTLAEEDARELAIRRFRETFPEPPKG